MKDHMNKKPTVLLDCDGVLSDFITATLDALFTASGQQHQHDDVRHWEVFDSLPPEAQVYKSEVYEYLKKEGGCFGIPLYAGSQDGVARLQAIADVIIVTSPFKGSKTWTHEREEWLEKYFSIAHENVIHAKRKEFVRGDFLIDDKPKNLQSWREAQPEGRPIYWKNPQFAGDLPGYVLCTQSWDDVVDAVLSFGPRK
jgi:5'(3')-deoxyribonucleotidase